MKSDTKKDLGMTAEDRKRLDAVVEAEAAELEAKQALERAAKAAVQADTAPLPEKPSFYEQVKAAALDLGDGVLENPTGLGMAEDHGAEAPAPTAGTPVKPTAKMALADIVIGEDRRDTSEENVAMLVASMAELGQLQPIVVTPAKRLVDGKHRCRAAGELGWTEIDVVVKPYDAIQADMAQIDANLCRNELEAMERAEAITKRKVLYLQLHPQTKQGGAPGKAGGGKVAVTKDAPVASFAADTEKRTGMSKRTVQEDTQIVKRLPKDLRDRIRRSELSKNRSELMKLSRLKNQDEQREVAVAVIDGKAKNVDDAMRRRRLRLRHEEIAQKNQEAAKLEAGEGPLAYPILLADVPWTYRRSLSKSRDISNVYDDMPTDEIANIPVADITAQDAVLFFWCPASKIVEAVEIMRRWGFEVRSSMVWDKGHIGPGIWTRIAHELILIGVKGSPPPPLEADKPASVIHAPRGEHSVKPEELHLAIEKAYANFAKIELFARVKRPGWKCLGNEIDGSDISLAIAAVVQRAGMPRHPDPDVPRADGLPSASEPAQDSATAPPAPPADPEPAPEAA